MTDGEPRLTATVSVVRSPDDWQGMLMDLALNGETFTHCQLPSDDGIRYTNQVADLRIDTTEVLNHPNAGAYTIAGLNALRNGWGARWGGSPPQVPPP